MMNTKAIAFLASYGLCATSGKSLILLATSMYVKYRSMTHDPEIYEDAELFNPGRHLSGKTKDPMQFTFGFGRRFVSTSSISRLLLQLAFTLGPALESISLMPTLSCSLLVSCSYLRSIPQPKFHLCLIRQLSHRKSSYVIPILRYPDGAAGNQLLLSANLNCGILL
jgi:hypothetical protein